MANLVLGRRSGASLAGPLIDGGLGDCRGSDPRRMRRGGLRLPTVDPDGSSQGTAQAGDRQAPPPVVQDAASAARDVRTLGARLAEAERLGTVAELSAALAHEINKPLAAIAIYVQSARALADADPPERAGLVEALDCAIEQTRRAGRAVEQVQRLYRGGSGEIESVDIGALLLRVVELARIDAAPHDLVLEYHADAELPPARCQPTQIQQVVLNLVRNAIESMLEIDCRNGRAVSIAGRRLDDAVAVEVRDCGKGVDVPAGIDVFAPFHTTKQDGLGMGLALSRTIALNHGGELDYHNVVDGLGNPIGAIFRFTLPV